MTGMHRGSTQSSYDVEFYAAMSAGSSRSATVVVPLVVSLFHPKSVVDVGCGVGTWLSIFVRHGVLDVLGLDGDYVDRSMLQVPIDVFCAADLMNPPPLLRRFDMAVCLEVAEHLDHRRARGLVEYLVRAADVVLFSAAIPGQGGTDHRNEQWPWYWRRLFQECGYEWIDCLRPHIWGNSHVEWWYQQNIGLFVKTGTPAASTIVEAVGPGIRGHAFELVDSRILQSLTLPGVRSAVSQLAGAVRRAIKRRLGDDLARMS